MRVIAINPKTAPIGTDGIVQQIESLLGSSGFAGAMIRRMADYPPQRTASGTRQSLGKSFGNSRRKRATYGGRGYRRTGTLGRNWRLEGPRRTANSIRASATNKTPYAVHVEGPKPGSKGNRQTAVMREIGWPNITDAARTEWVRGGHLIRIIRVLTQQDPTIRNRRRRF